ncbi:succinate dehydrogenase assembly factor 4, mitochondrial-like isoform X1 [Polyodon spathula]|uniref:succinate dehydrogenase assembly factor 4, mitochondrial-like isoform X1 n=1 Tax=Polyodon spathula TaxID=7913 RepID=UPI001B7EF6A8|nr:succinate dehydrogenase assembly factor 4, mitochondrial-like isoform X1 [Polyodon spathula]
MPFKGLRFAGKGILLVRRALLEHPRHRSEQLASLRLVSSDGKPEAKKAPLRTPKTPQGRFDSPEQAPKETYPLERFPDDINPVTKEKGGPRGPEPTRYGDWERKGRCIDF